MIAIVILSVLLLAALVTIISLVIIINKKLKIIDIYEEWVSNTQGKMETTYLRLKDIDDKQMFEKDDDVGFVFTSILTMIDALNKEIQ